MSNCIWVRTTVADLNEMLKQNKVTLYSISIYICFIFLLFFPQRRIIMWYNLKYDIIQGHKCLNGLWLVCVRRPRYFLFIAWSISKALYTLSSVWRLQDGRSTMSMHSKGCCGNDWILRLGGHLRKLTLFLDRTVNSDSLTSFSIISFKTHGDVVVVLHD